jgi:undecaprenyl diphosphate synthase
MQSTLEDKLHVAIIMDGNGRWATARGLARTLGHVAGVEAIRRIVKTAPEHGVGTLTIYAFSCDNWNRPEAEIVALMGLLRLYLRTETARLIRNGVRLSVIGRRDRLPAGLAIEVARAEQATAAGATLQLRIAFDYSARDAILWAAARVSGPGDLTRDGFARLLTGDGGPPDVDLLIRTSGEKRLSDFLLWESAYAELYFTDRMWPDFGPADLAEAVEDFRRRDRRFGGVVAPAAAA